MEWVSLNIWMRKDGSIRSLKGFDEYKGSNGGLPRATKSVYPSGDMASFGECSKYWKTWDGLLEVFLSRGVEYYIAVPGVDAVAEGNSEQGTMVRWSRSNTRDPFLESGIIIGVKDADCLFCFGDRQRAKTMTLQWLVLTTQYIDNGFASCWNHFEISRQSWEMEFCKVSCLFCYGGSVDGMRVMWNPLSESRVFKIVLVFKWMIRIMAINCDSEISHLSINDGSHMDIVGGSDKAHTILCFISTTLLQLFTALCNTIFTMSQGSLMASDGCNKSKDKLATRLKITVLQFDNTKLINAYSRTLIGRCMNPVAQEMKSLLFMLPRIWKVEDRVAGADLGMGRFQFDFDEEEDITVVLQMEPYHFNGWMVVLVRWEPIMDPNYPSALTFWVHMMGVPLHFWAETTFISIGREVDLDGGRVQITLDGFKELVFETLVAFH
ncbi:unnamed protein product [Thlaspi arvense]|uniref:DUF4283 domain-containing protein n=1 Tax=Thlaspi arvense TaxID=13288 RepID=A0AAU9SUN1_THLAR|nr:unnamed protein product [Thlaspi arvense]